MAFYFQQIFHDEEVTFEDEIGVVSNINHLNFNCFIYLKICIRSDSLVTACAHSLSRVRVFATPWTVAC